MNPEERLTKVEEHLLVTAEMMRRNEARWAESFEHLTGIMDRVEMRLDQTVVRQVDAARRQEEADERQAAAEQRHLEAEERLKRIETSLAALVENINRFIQRRDGNGHHDR